MKVYFISRLHRWLGLTVGVQFLFWTIGGLYFSWSNIDEIHGDLNRKIHTVFNPTAILVSPSVVINDIKRKYNVNSIISLQLVQILGNPYYSIVISTAEQKKRFLYHAQTGELRNPLNADEAILVAKESFIPDVPVNSIVRLDTVGSHHEYRDQPLPAYAVSFLHPTNTVVYVSTEIGTVQRFRNRSWRIFDFLWMLHTMDFQTRDNINNIVLRIFSIAGLMTIISGFMLYILTWYKAKKIK